MYSNKILQTALRTLTEKKMPVAIFLQNGIKLEGCMQAFDQEVILLKSKERQSITILVYQTTVATISLLPIEK